MFGIMLQFPGVAANPGMRPETYVAKVPLLPARDDCR